jgi:hypothetical protein
LLAEEEPVKKMIAVGMIAATLAMSLAGGSASASHQKDACKNDGYERLTNPATGQAYENQGQCIKTSDKTPIKN